MNPWKHRGRQELAVCEEMGAEEIRRGTELTLPQASFLLLQGK